MCAQLVAAGIFFYGASRVAVNAIDNYNSARPLTENLGRGGSPADLAITVASTVAGGPIGGVGISASTTLPSRVVGALPRVAAGAALGCASSAVSESAGSGGDVAIGCAAGAIAAGPVIDSEQVGLVYNLVVSIGQALAEAMR